MATAIAAQKKARPVFAEKQATKVTFRLLKENDRKLRPDMPLFKPYVKLKNVSTINKDGMDVVIRYVRGQKSIYVHEQEPDNRTLPDNVVNGYQNDIIFSEGVLEVPTSNKPLLEFLRMCSANANSEYRISTDAPRFAEVIADANLETIEKEHDALEKAIDMAKNADQYQIGYHAKYLGIPFYDPNTGASRSWKAIKADYLQAAIKTPVKFMETYDDPALKMRYYVKRGLDEGTIDVASVYGQAIWSGSKNEITEIPSGSDEDAIINTLVQFAQTRKGEAFLKEIRDKFSGN